MFRAHTSAREVSRHVAALPDRFEVRRLGAHWVVLGPTGIFVVGRTRRELAHETERTAELAHELRGRLAESVPWVPFVDALVVAEGEHHHLACTVVPVNMLVFALTAGAATIEPHGVDQLRPALDRAVAAMERPEPRPLDPA